MTRPASDLSKAATFLVGAVVCAILANAVARPGRRLGWTGWTPPGGVPSLPPPPQPAVAPEPPPAPSPPPAAAAATALPAQPKPSVPPRTPAPAVRAQPRPPAAPAQGAGARFQADPSSVIRDLSSADAWTAYQNQIPFLDARRTEQYQDGHVPGAWSVPVWESELPARITEFEARTNPGFQDPIAVYCDGGDCEDSRLLAGKLVALGYRNLLVYRGGFPDWRDHGRPVQKGTRP